MRVADDTRYVMIGTAIEFDDLMELVRSKFGLRGRVRCRVQDEGDMITMADQDDLDMLVETAKNNARRERADMGKMEVCFSSATLHSAIADRGFLDLGARDSLRDKHISRLALACFNWHGMAGPGSNSSPSPSHDPL